MNIISGVTFSHVLTAALLSSLGVPVFAGNPVTFEFQPGDEGANCSEIVKDLDPDALVFGPALYGWGSYVDFAAPDWSSYSAEYDWFPSTYLGEMKKLGGTFTVRATIKLISCKVIAALAFIGEAEPTSEKILFKPLINRNCLPSSVAFN